jgi:hypothetical protein
MGISLLGWSEARAAAQPGPVPWAYTLHRPATYVLVSRTVTQGGSGHATWPPGLKPASPEHVSKDD